MSILNPYAKAAIDGFVAGMKDAMCMWVEVTVLVIIGALIGAVFMLDYVAGQCAAAGKFDDGQQVYSCVMEVKK